MAWRVRFDDQPVGRWQSRWRRRFAGLRALPEELYVTRRWLSGGRQRAGACVAHAIYRRSHDSAERPWRSSRRTGLGPIPPILSQVDRMIAWIALAGNA